MATDFFIIYIYHYIFFLCMFLCGNRKNAKKIFFLYEIKFLGIFRMQFHWWNFTVFDFHNSITETDSSFLLFSNSFSEERKEKTRKTWFQIFTMVPLFLRKCLNFFCAILYPFLFGLRLLAFWRIHWIFIVHFLLNFPRNFPFHTES